MKSSNNCPDTQSCKIPERMYLAKSYSLGTMPNFLSLTMALFQEHGNKP
jgi:hypothetical protein